MRQWFECIGTRGWMQREVVLWLCEIASPGLHLDNASLDHHRHVPRIDVCMPAIWQSQGFLLEIRLQPFEDT